MKIVRSSWRSPGRWSPRPSARQRKALRDAGLTVDDIKGVVMVGGATRMPHVQRPWRVLQAASR
jgi:molecular chaperone DnaK (HSP70)